MYYGTGGTAIYVVDRDTGERRDSLLRDVRDNARIADALPHVHVFTINVFPRDIEAPAAVDVNRFYWSLKNTTKHVMGGVYSLEGTERVIRMAETIAGRAEGQPRHRRQCRVHRQPAGHEHGCGSHRARHAQLRFMAEEHTIRHMREEFSAPRCSDRGSYLQWRAQGAPDARQRARRRLDEILANHRPRGLEEPLDRRLRAAFPEIRD